MRNRLIEAMEKAIWELRQWPEKTVHIFHHNDADGLSSGAILTRAFERQQSIKKVSFSLTFINIRFRMQNTLFKRR